MRVLNRAGLGEETHFKIPMVTPDFLVHPETSKAANESLKGIQLLGRI